MGQILDVLRTSAEKGRLLELVLEDVLRDRGFHGIRRQLSGTQFGFDVVAYRPSPNDGRQEIWKFECKNIAKPVTPQDIAPKLIWYCGKTTIDRFVIVTTSDLSNDLDYLLRDHPFPMPISVWTGELLETLVETSPRALDRLGLPASSIRDIAHVPPACVEFKPRVPVRLDVVHELDPPSAFDYLLIDRKVAKTYSARPGLRMLAAVTNHGDLPFDLHSLMVTTLDYRQLKGRVVRLEKPKGVFQPIKLTFGLSQIPGGSRSVLGDRVWRVAPRHTDVIALVLDVRTLPGVYRIVFSAQGVLDGQRVTMFSPSFLVHIDGEKEDLLELAVHGRHYDSPTTQLLALGEDEWNMLRALSARNDRKLFLGPTLYELLHGHRDSVWVVREVAVQSGDADGLSWELVQGDEPAVVVLDLGTAVDEELYSLQAAQQRIALTDGWQDLFPIQLGRRLACEG